MSDSFRQRLRRGDTLIGSLVTLPSPEVAEILAGCGFDWLFIDTEHGAFGPVEAQGLLQAVAGRCPCLIRVPAGDEVSIKKALDIGADGIIAPQVHSAAEAEAIVRRCKYPPQGTRGVGIGRAHDYGYGFSDYLARANEELAVVIQAETAGAVEEIDAIAALPGVDAVLIGPYDLSASLGHIGDIAHPRVQAAMDRVAEACRAAGIGLGVFGISAEAVAPYAGQGFNLLAVGADGLFLSSAARDALGRLREAD